MLAWGKRHLSSQGDKLIDSILMTFSHGVLGLGWPGVEPPGAGSLCVTQTKFGGFRLVGCE